MNKNLELALEFKGKDDEKYIYYLTKAADQGYARAQNKLATIYLKGIYITKDTKKALELYTKAAEQGFANAQCNLAYLYEKGIHVPRDIEKALELYTKAADQGDSSAQCNLAYLYEVGELVHQDTKKALELYTKAADQGFARAQSNLAIIYEEGKYISKDIKKAIELFTLAIKQGNQYAMCNLASLYMNDENEEYDSIKAIQLLEQSVALNHIPGKFELALWYEKGKGVDLDYQKAIELYTEVISVESKFNDVTASAYYRLGYLYYYGNGVKKDLFKAKEYFEKAKELKYECNYILETVNNLLGIKTEESQFKMILNSINDTKELRIKVLEMLSQYDFEPETQKFFVTAIRDYYRKITDKDEEYEEDFSGVILELTKGIEKELQKYLLNDYLTYLENFNSSEVTNKYLLRKDNALNLKRFEKFTLGELKDLIGLKDNPISNGALSNDKIYINKRIISEETEKVISLDKKMLEYLSKELFNEKAFGDLLEEEITDYMSKFCKTIEQINEEFRNPSAHTKFMTAFQAEQMIDWVLFGKKLLPNFINKIKK